MTRDLAFALEILVTSSDTIRIGLPWQNTDAFFLLVTWDLEAMLEIFVIRVRVPTMLNVLMTGSCTHSRSPWYLGSRTTGNGLA